MDQVIGGLVEIACASIADTLDCDYNFSWEQAKKNGVDHLVKKIVVTERHGKNGHDRKTTCEMYSRQDALEELSQIMGLRKQQAKNPHEAAMEALDDLKAEFPNLPAGKPEEIIAKTFGVPITDLK
jgi:hypothetical protein